MEDKVDDAQRANVATASEAVEAETVTEKSKVEAQAIRNSINGKLEVSFELLPRCQKKRYSMGKIFHGMILKIIVLNLISRPSKISSLHTYEVHCLAKT